MGCFCRKPGADLLAAATQGDAEGVVRALQRGADANCRDARMGAAPLAHAALGGHVACIRALLLHSKPDVRARDSVGDTALHYAARTGHADCCSLLLSAGADVADRNLNGENALLMAGRSLGVNEARAEAVRMVLLAAAPRARKLRHLRKLDLIEIVTANDSASGNSGSSPSVQSSGSTGSVPQDWALDCSKLQYGEKVAGGSYGDVYAGNYLGAPVAIKALRLHSDERQSRILEDFLKELSVLRKLRHKHVVQLIGASAGPPACVLVTEFCSGGALSGYLRRNRPVLPHAEQLRLALHVARGMDYLHRCGVVHRDLKAANLLLDEHGVCKVGDFGLVRVIDGTAGAESSLTSETGTYRWMAPEVITHARYGAKCDVYSFAIVLWEITAAGAMPYPGVPALHVALGVAQSPGLRPNIPVTAPAELARLMPRCWAEVPDERPAFEELVRTLEAAQIDTTGLVSGA
jgi:tRNA A-37 threonylcarbamoyl transferase component Bud32